MAKNSLKLHTFSDRRLCDYTNCKAVRKSSAIQDDTEREEVGVGAWDHLVEGGDGEGGEVERREGEI